MQTLVYYNPIIDRTFLDDKELYFLMGYGNHVPPENILEMIEGMFEEIVRFCRPVCGYTIYEGGLYEKGRVRIGDTIFNTGVIIATAMKEAQYMAVFTATLGAVFDNWLRTINKEDDIVKEFVANSMGSILAEGVVSNLMKRLETEMMAFDLKISNNYSPGYCDWALSEQKELFSILPAGISGIQLTDSCLMLPVKSVSGIVAIGRDAKKRAYKCDICQMKNCVKNLKRYTDNVMKSG